jgi:outer membrane protein
MGRKCLSFVAVALILMAVATTLSAQDAGWTVRVRAISINPNDSSGTIDATGSRVAVDSKIVPEVDFTFKFNERFGMELILATARHDLSASGGLVAGIDLGSIRLLPPTLTFQYYFPTGPHVIPYIGLGVNYTQFSSYNLSSDLRMAGVKGVDFSNSFDVAGQFGLDVFMDKHWLFNFDVKYIRIDTDATIRTVTGAVVDKVSVEVNPWVFGFGVGYRF